MYSTVPSPSFRSTLLYHVVWYYVNTDCAALHRAVGTYCTALLLSTVLYSHVESFTGYECYDECTMLRVLRSGTDSTVCSAVLNSWWVGQDPLLSAVH